jgi:aspartate kinase
MVTAPLVVKFGGDALALPERIAGAARQVGRRLAAGPVVVVASARRGVTDHLLGLVERVKENSEPEGRGSGALAAAADRAVAAGEVVAASLLAVALNQLGIPAEVLDAREAGLRSDGEWARAQLTGVNPVRISRRLRRGITPVVTGFQGWHRGRTTTLGRGGSDTTAVALAAALGARQCELVKHHGGVFTADPNVVPEARLIPSISHRSLTELSAAGAKVMSLRAALVAEREAVPLRFSSLEDEATATDVSSEPSTDTSGIAVRGGRYRFTAHSAGRIGAGRQRAFLAAVAAAGIPAELEVVEDGAGSRLDLLVDPDDLETAFEAARGLLPRGRELALLATGLSTVTVVGLRRDAKSALRRAAYSCGAQIHRISAYPDRIAFLVPDAAAPVLSQALHATLFPSTVSRPENASSSEAHPLTGRRYYVGHR